MQKRQKIISPPSEQSTTRHWLHLCRITFQLVAEFNCSKSILYSLSIVNCPSSIAYLPCIPSCLVASVPFLYSLLPPCPLLICLFVLIANLPNCQICIPVCLVASLPLCLFCIHYCLLAYCLSPYCINCQIAELSNLYSCVPCCLVASVPFLYSLLPSCPLPLCLVFCIISSNV